MLTAVPDLQAIQARQVLRGTVAELVKETRRQEAEGTPSFLLALHATLSAVHAPIHAPSAYVQCSMQLKVFCACWRACYGGGGKKGIT